MSGKKSKTKVLVCKKSSCRKNGGKAVLKRAKKLVRDLKLKDQVSVKSTGCMGKCGKGPVIVIGKTQYRKVKAKRLSRLISKHIG